MKNKLHIILLACLLSLASLISSAQTSSWDFLNPPKGDVNLYSLNIKHSPTKHFVIGAFSSNLDFNGTQLSHIGGGYGIFVATYSKDGTPITADKIGYARGASLSPNNNFRFALTPDSNGDYYVVISFWDSVSLKGTTYYSPQGVLNALFAKLDSSNNIIWVKQISSPQGAGIGVSTNSIQLGENKGVYAIAGSGDSVYYDNNFISPQKGVYLFKLDSMGNIVYYKRSGNNTSGSPRACKVTNDAIYVLGAYKGSNVKFDSLDLNFDNFGTSYGLIKYDKQGNLKWVKQLGGSGVGSSVSIFEIRSDSKENIYLGGVYQIGNGGNFYVNGLGTYSVYDFVVDVFVVKYDSSGNPKWMRRTKTGSQDYYCGFTINNKDEIYLANVFDVKNWFEGETDVLFGYGTYDVMLTKLDTLGNIKWMTAIGGTNFNEVVSLESQDSTLYLLGMSNSFPCHFADTTYNTQSPGNLFLARLNKYEVWPVGISDHAISSFSLYPNPSLGNTTLSLSTPRSGYYTLCDMSGRTLLRQNLNLSETHYTISTSTLSPGIYLIQVNTPQDQRTEKLVVE